MTRRLARAEGFSLIELMVVVAILGVLAISVFAIYQDLVARSRQAADEGTLGALRSAASMYVARNGGLPPDKATLDTLVVPTPPQFLYYSGYAYDPATGLITPIP